MALPEHLQRFMDEPIRVLDDGHVQLIDVMGDDDAVVQAARVSYGTGTKRVSEDRHLIRYLMRHRHTTPFEMASIKFRVRVPMDCWRQWIRHRTASVNEYSTRYSEAIDSAQRTDPDAWRAQATTNKQGSGDFITAWADGFMVGETPLRFDTNDGESPNGAWLGQDFYGSPGEYLSEREQELQRLSREIYDERLKLGVAREQARKDLPLSTYTEAYWKMDLHNLFHFLGLRMDAHAQLEIRSFANAIAEIVKVWVPWCWEAFEDYRLNGMYLSRFEVAGLRSVLQMLAEQVPGWSFDRVVEAAARDSGLALPKEGQKESRELTELQAKMRRLLGGR